MRKALARSVGPLEFGRKTGYTIGFFFWAIAASSRLTSLLTYENR